MRISVSEAWSALQRNMPSHTALFSAVVTFKVLYIVTEVSFLPMKQDINYNFVVMFYNTDMNKLFPHQPFS
jgi:hypothetical protein